MKKYNKNIIAKTKKVHKGTLNKSKKKVRRLTKPSKKVSHIGSLIGGSVGVGLVLAGTTTLVFSRSLWGMGSVIAGAVTITSNAVNIKKNK